MSHLPLPEGFRAELRPYQAQGVAWLDLLRESELGGVLADDMGLGKTVQILALLALEKARGNLAQPALIVAPTSLMTNWFNEAQKFAPDLRVLVLHGSGRKQNFATIPEHDLVLTTYPLIARDREVLSSRDWHMAVLDEAQTIKNPNAATTRWLRDVKARHRFCLTGTPMENHLGELWSIMSFANPGYLGDKAAFSRLWRLPIEKRADNERATALARRVKPFLLRRTKTEVATELPAKSEIVERIVLEDSQRDLYDSIRLSMSDKVRKAIEQRGLARSHIIVLEALLRMRQACCDPLLLKLDDGVQRPSAKLDRCDGGAGRVNRFGSDSIRTDNALPRYVCPEKLLTGRRILRTAMDVVPGNVQYAGVAEVVRCFCRRSLYHRFANLIRQAIDYAPGSREETATPVMVMSGE